MDVATSSKQSPVNLTLLLTISLAAASKMIEKGGSKRIQHVGGPYQCRTCGRRFSTFQALGGHRTSHKRPRVRADGLQLLLGGQPGKAARPVHRCGTCGNVFVTGQAPGGHMRPHRQVAGAVAMKCTDAETLMSDFSDQRDDENDVDLSPGSLIQFI